LCPGAGIPGHTSESLTGLLLGNGCGQNGSGYFGMALTIEKARIPEALKRTRKTTGAATL